MPISNPAAGAVLVVAETEVYSGNSPITWTDLDLSSVIGVRACVVILKIKGQAGKRVAVRKNGDTDDFYNFTIVPQGAASGESSGEHNVYVVATDNAGIIEWICEGALAATVDIIAYFQA